ncbi:glycosyltransferase family 61 protein [Roseivivax sp. GX 12232]|uniref:glycosyltransferase 61 family protein n=1 Tax=Roseivivax sp. GX 12232 TaxID=2900547 RepID=UPI001E56B87B|nr:glycosyltransferase 61 family protein [Roseivivax sp. GX 12232]MCE0506865.1 glycosyltransferase family 61 protein [Roseivivax sp. GX 12232]
MAVPGDASDRPLPEGGWSQEIESLRGALVMPPAESAFRQAAGVLRADGSHCETGAFWRNHRALTLAPEAPAGPPDAPPEVLPGRWLWGGVLWVHFGHFLVESTGRLWGLDAGQGPFDGILYIPKRPARGQEVAGWQRAFWQLAGCDLPVHVATSPTEVEELVVPGQGFGLGEIVSGTPAFRAFMAEFGRDVPAEGPERLYISRSKLGLSKGGLIGESRLEAHLEAEGYEIFHPQDHDLPTQVARYKAARQVLAAEGSALHLFGFVGRPDQRVGMILRRQSGATEMIARHLRSFCGIELIEIARLQRILKKKGGFKKRHDLGVIHMEELRQALVAQGFISDGPAWERLRWSDVRRVIGDKYEPRRRAEARVE